MTETRTITLAGRAIEVPPLPLRINMIAYPICRKLTNAEFVERYIAAARAKSLIEVTTEEMADLAEIAFCGAQAADRSLARDAFDEWSISPSELIDAFFPVRLQTQGWVAGEPQEGQSEPGEAEGAKKPLK